jgi:hypothetical protein
MHYSHRGAGESRLAALYQLRLQCVHVDALGAQQQQHNYHCNFNSSFVKHNTLLLVVITTYRRFEKISRIRLKITLIV